MCRVSGFPVSRGAEARVANGLGAALIAAMLSAPAAPFAIG